MLAWALWDCGATGVNAVVITFVFSVYLTEQVGSGLPGPTTPASWLGRVLTIAGLFVALLAPATGIWVTLRTVAELHSPCSPAWSSR